MVLVTALGSKVQDVGWICHRPLCPVGDVLTKTTADLRIEAHHVVLAQRLQARIGPIAHRNHHRFLIHFELARLGEMQATLPSITEAVWPFAGIAVTFMPDVLLCPKPPLLAQSQNQFNYVGMALAVFGLFLDIQDKGAGRFKNAEKLGRAFHKPVDILFRLDTTISVLTTVCIGR